MSYQIISPSQNKNSRFDTFHDVIWIQSDYFNTGFGRYTVSIMSKFDHSFGYFLRLIWKHQGDPVSFDQYFKVNFSYPPAHHPKLAGYGFSYETLSDVEPVSWKLMSNAKKESLNNRFLMYAILKNGSSDLRLFEVQNNLESWVKALGTLNIPDIST